MNIKYINRITGEVETESPPAEGMLKFLYDNPLGKNLLLPLIRRKFITRIYGRLMDSKTSVKKIKAFVDDLHIDMNESKKTLEEFTSFNDFFSRELKPGARIIEEGLVSPGDGKILAFETINEVQEFFIKGQDFNLRTFLDSQEMAEQYQDASMVILRLAPNDYHRYHFPLDGIPALSQEIKGHYYSVSPYALLHNFARVFCQNKRELCRFKTSIGEEILIIPVGATMVGSIVSTYSPDQSVRKGDEMGYFAFGGSTIVLLFNSEKFKVNLDLIQNTKANMETYVKMGSQIANVMKT